MTRVAFNWGVILGVCGILLHSTPCTGYVPSHVSYRPRTRAGMPLIGAPGCPMLQTQPSCSLNNDHATSRLAVPAVGGGPGFTRGSGRRGVLNWFLYTAVVGWMAPGAARAAEEFTTFTDPDAACTFAYPEDFVVTSKPLKTHLVERNVKSETIRGFSAGLAVDPIKLASLEAFGTPEYVGDRVVDVERRKDGVLEVKLLGTGATREDGVSYYTIEYTSESTRGNNHIISTVAVRNNKLYVFTTQSKQADFEALESSLREMASSFRLTTG